MEGNQEGARLFSVVPTGSARGNGHKLKPMKFHLKARNHLLTVRGVKQRTELSREAVESPSLEILKTQLDYVLCNQLKLTLLEQLAWTKASQEVPSNPEADPPSCEFPGSSFFPSLFLLPTWRRKRLRCALSRFKSQASLLSKQGLTQGHTSSCSHSESLTIVGLTDEDGIRIHAFRVDIPCIVCCGYEKFLRCAFWVLNKGFPKNVARAIIGSHQSSSLLSPHCDQCSAGTFKRQFGLPSYFATFKVCR